jgi:hypothetical protein
MKKHGEAKNFGTLETITRRESRPELYGGIDDRVDKSNKLGIRNDVKNKDLPTHSETCKDALYGLKSGSLECEEKRP